MPKILVTLTILFLTLSAVFGVLNTTKARNLRAIATRSDTARTEAELTRTSKEKQLQASIAEAAVRTADTEAKVASAEADLVKSQSDKAELHNQLLANQAQIADLQKRVDEAAPKELMPDALPMPGAGDLQAQLEETRKQLDSAERERQLLSDKIRTTQEHTALTDAPQKQRAANASLRGTVLAVNQAYNFVVLNMGGRQGVQANSELIVMRGGTLIGRIRVSSVEPATAIGDIIGSSLPRGVQVQPGDTVIYAGTNS